jgi:hypothetical protein
MLVQTRLVLGVGLIGCYIAQDDRDRAALKPPSHQQEDIDVADRVVRVPD